MIRTTDNAFALTGHEQLCDDIRRRTPVLYDLKHRLYIGAGFFEQSTARFI